MNRILFTALAIALCPVATLAQTTQAANAASRPPIEQRLEQDMIAMTDMAQALAKNLGQLHYLRTLCFGKSDQKWRKYAQNMMDIEAPKDREKRSLLIKAFNEGYYDQQQYFDTCSDEVSVDAAAFAENGRHLASMLGDPYRE